MRNLYDPASTELFRICRSKIDKFLRCPRCFYLDRRLGIPQPGYPFSLNTVIDALLKKEFDMHRKNGTSHPYMLAHGIDAVPFAYAQIDEWRDSLHRGVAYVHPATSLLIIGGVDDVWVWPNGELMIVDYKVTSKADEVRIDAEWQIGYKANGYSGRTALR